MKTTVNTIVKAGCIITDIRTEYGVFEMVSKAWSDGSFNEMLRAEVRFCSPAFTFKCEYEDVDGLCDIRDSIKEVAENWRVFDMCFDDMSKELHERADMLEFFSLIMNYLHQLREGEIMS